MKAAYFTEPLKISIEETKSPIIEENEILLKVKAAAVCGTDLRIYRFGHFKIPEGEKRVLGHEIAGEIIEVGSKVKGYSVGMRAVVAPNVGCGKCIMCIKGYNQLCPDYEAFGVSMDGGFQEKLLIPSSAVERGNVIPIPENLSYEEAVLTEPFSCTYSSYNALKTEPGDTVLIVGAGPIGACHVMINKMAGARKIMVADIAADRLEQIKEFGADVIIDSSKTSLKDFVMAETAGLGADVIITANSSPDIQRESLEMAAPLGRINFFGGMPKGKEMVSLNTNLIHYKELRVLATTGSSISDFYQSLSIVASGKLSLDKLVSERFALCDIQNAFDFALSGAGMKALIIND